MKNNKQFDCVEMKHEGAKISQSETENLTLAERLKYWKKKTVGLKKRQTMLNRFEKTTGI